MLDIRDKNGKVVAVFMDDGTIIKRNSSEDDIDTLIKEQLLKEKRKK